MSKAVINANRSKGTIDRNIYGQFSEHLGRCIYNGVYVGEGSGIPNENGMRTDVVQALRALRVPVLRWPGGCFADTYHWQDGIGPRESRKKIVNTNWGGVTEDNSFGTHEFLELCRQLGCEPYLSGNVGGMRFPVATAVQKNANADITTPKGQVITIIGIVASVVANLVILLAIVLAGNWILSILPEAVLSAFGFCVISMMGSMMVMNVSTRGGLKSLPGQLPYIIFGVVMWYICNKVLTSLMAWGMALAVGGAVLIGYFKYRRDLAKAEAGDK